MIDSTRNDELETKIIEVAKHLFIENGFAETSMSDIAAKVGINRPGLHYYFRTKDKMFQAVFGKIILSLVPRIQSIILQKDKTIRERIEGVIDAYYGVFLENPCLPLFVMREMHRDVNHLIEVVDRLQLEQYFSKIAEGLQEEIDSGYLKPVPLRFVFYTFYSLLTMPFVTKNMGVSVFLEEGETFEEMLAKWKPYVVRQVENLLV